MSPRPNRIGPFLRLYAHAAWCCARALTVGVASRSERTLLRGICEARGIRVRPTEALLPEIPIEALNLSDQTLKIEAPEGTDGEVGTLELLIINSLVRLLGPERLFEFGSFRGRTTLNLAANSSDSATVFTLDLPEQDLDHAQFDLLPGERNLVSKAAAGYFYRGTKYASKVVALAGDSATFDYTPYLNSIDLVFVDASHGYDAVLNDSLRAIELLRNGRGIILWHDYDIWYEGVTRALGFLYTTNPDFRGLAKIRNTSLAYLRCG
jgi:predicted O-methyltransferase YrrM